MSNSGLTGESQQRRVEYEVLAQLTRGQALHHLRRTRDALPALHRAVDGDDDLAAEAQATARRIATALPEGDLRQMLEKLAV